MNEENPNLGAATPRRGNRPPIEDEESMLEEQDLDEQELDSETGVDPDGDSDLDPSSEEDGSEESEQDTPEEAGVGTSPRFEDIKVKLRKLSEGRCVVSVDIDLAFDAPEPGAEDEEREPEAPEYSLDADDVDSMLDEPSPRRVTPMAAPAGRGPATVQGVSTPRARPPSRLKFDRKKFFRGYAAAFSKLDRRQMKGLDALLTAAEADPKLTDVRWLAYMLATVQHECAGTWRPIGEFGKGKGRPYGRPVVVRDPQGRRYRNVYYGRGYVQLTWKNNYQRMGKLLKNRLVYEPTLALKPSVAYRIMSLGMRRGLFTGKKLGDYIRGGKKDYVNARRIINALDQAHKIARNAVKLERILRRSAVRPGR